MVTPQDGGVFDSASRTITWTFAAPVVPAADALVHFRARVAFPLADLGLPENELDRRVAEKLDLVEIKDLADLMPSELSTGMKRAVASPSFIHAASR